MNADQIGRVAHEANRALTQILQDVPVQPSWDDAPTEMRQSTIGGVAWRLEHPFAEASAQHEEWMRAKLADGWKLGAVKSAEHKTHPAMVPYEQLAPGLKLKDAVFGAIIDALADAE